MSNLVTERNDEPRDRRRRANRERILAAALELVVEEGFERLTLHRVADATDYTRAALYRYFDSKETLISALTVCVIDEISVRVASRLAGIEAAPLVKVAAAIDEYTSFAASEPAKFGMLSMLLADSRVILPDVASEEPVAALERALAPLSALLAIAAERGDIDDGDSDARAAILFASVHGVLQLRKQSLISQRLAPVETLCSLAVDSLLAGWGGQSNASGSAS